jgi:hypothetical protein
VYLSFSVQLITTGDEVLRLGSEFVEKDELITEYESELHSQREQAKKAMQAKNEMIRALEKELDALEQEVRNASMIKVRFFYKQ